MSRGRATDQKIPHSKFVEEFQDSTGSVPGRAEKETDWPLVEMQLAKTRENVEQNATECKDNKTHHRGHKEGPTWSNAQDIWLSPKGLRFNSRCGKHKERKNMNKLKIYLVYSRHFQKTIWLFLLCLFRLGTYCSVFGVYTLYRHEIKKIE